MRRPSRHVLFRSLFIVCGFILCGTSGSAAQEGVDPGDELKRVWLDEMAVSKIKVGWGSPQRNRSVSGNALRIGGRRYSRGVGVHAQSVALVDLRGVVRQIVAFVGVDDAERGGPGSVEFLVKVDRKPRWRSGILRKGDQAKTIDLKGLSGARWLELIVTDGGDGIGQDHANWAEMRFELDKPFAPMIVDYDVLPRPVSPANRSEARAHLIPYPRQVEWSDGDCPLARVDLVLPEEGTAATAFTGESLKGMLRAAGVGLDSGGGEESLTTITLAFGALEGVRHPEEAYRLQVRKDRVDITAPGAAGLFYAVQTLGQLMMEKDGRTVLPCCRILDWPAFKYRGLMHDVGRNFQTIPFLEEQMGILARYKLNVFHWHLADHPAWRVECRAYPQLNAAENHRPTRSPGRFYTYEEMNAFKAYCEARHILIIPELDMPGHSEYFTTAMKTDMQSAGGMEALERILNEFCDHFDVPLVHIGSDEVEIRTPEFLPRMTGVLRSRGKEVVVWRPGGLPDESVITQLWSRRSVPLPGVRVLDSRGTYVNHMDPLSGIHRLFVMKPCRGIWDADLALGGILCHWPDTNVEGDRDTFRTNPVLPALLTFAERIWRGAENDREDLYARIADPGTEVFEEFEAFEADLIDHRDRFFQDWPFQYVAQTNIPWRLIGPFDHGGDFSAVFDPERVIRQQYTYRQKQIRWTDKDSIGGTIHLQHFFGWEGHLPKGSEGTVYALTHIRSDRDRDAHMWIQFGTPSTSSRRLNGNPPAGAWSPFESRIWLNGEEIPPPEWRNPGPLGSTKAHREIPFTNEAYHYRDPARIRLREGWNRVLIKAPFGRPPEGYGGSGKWMFTCVPVSWDGKRARELDGIAFSSWVPRKAYGR